MPAPSPPLAGESRRGEAACSVRAARAPSLPAPASGGGDERHEQAGKSKKSYSFPSWLANTPAPYTALPPTNVSSDVISPTLSTGTVM